MIFIDTSHLIALAMPTDALHSAALKWSDAARGACLTTEFVLIEFLNALSAPKHRQRAVKMIAQIDKDQSLQLINCDTELFKAGFALYAQRSDKSWSLIDCVSFVVMKEIGCQEALTHDVHFEQAGFKALLRHDPPAN